jgi:hypothetical protein
MEAHTSPTISPKVSASDEKVKITLLTLRSSALRPASRRSIPKSAAWAIPEA